MIALEDTIVLLLASGLSRRFGEGNKLLADLGGKTLVAHAAELAGSLPVLARLAVVPPRDGLFGGAVQASGFETIVNPDPAAGREQSLRLGLAAAIARQPAAVLVLLGDMPHISADHVAALAAAASPDRGAISVAGSYRGPPVLIPVALAREAVADSTMPMRVRMAEAVEVSATESMLRDYDLPADFERLG
jgi:molybdenum cofactor cytidylyltransferase